MAAALTGGHLIQKPTRNAIAVGTRETSSHVAISRSRSPRWWRALRGVGRRARRRGRDTPLGRDDATRDQTHLQAVAGRRVHVVYFDTIMAAADVLDDRAWGDARR